MPAALYSHDRPRFAGSVIATLAHQPPRSSTPLSSYTSLDHALDPLDPPGARESNRSAHQPPPSLSPSSQMTSDGRYAYPPPPDAAPAYGYAPYPPPYAHGQYPPDASRPSGRPASSSGQPPPPQAPPPYHGPPGYPAHPPYPPPTYGVAPAPPGPWTGEGWTHYPHYPPPHPPGQEYPHSTNGSRPEPPAEDHRGYPPPPAREERPPRPAEAPTQSKVRNGKESEPPAPGPSRSPPLGMDYGKLIEQYGILLETAASLTHPSNSPRLSIPQETMERMMQAAAFGMQSLESASRRIAPNEPPRPPVDERRQDEGQSDEGDAQAQSAPSGSAENGDGQTCLGCNATSTPEWRRGPMGPRTLCNACGLVYAKLIKKRNRDPNRGRTAYLNPQPGAQNAAHFVTEHGDPDSGGSDDEDSYGSQDRRSDGGYHGRD